MKRSFKAIALAIGLVTLKMGMQAATTAPATVDPDLSVYNAFISLGFNAASPTTLPTSITAANAKSYLDALTAAETFFDGTTYKTNITNWKGAVQGYIETAAAAAKALDDARKALTGAAATNYTAPSDLSTQIANMAPQFNALTSETDKTALTSVYNNIKIAYQNLSTQTTATVATYLGNLVELSNTISKNSAMFAGQNAINGYASAVTTNADSAKNITNLLDPQKMNTPDLIKTTLGDATNLNAVKSWRAIKAVITPSVPAQ